MFTEGESELRAGGRPSTNPFWFICQHRKKQAKLRKLEVTDHLCSNPRQIPFLMHCLLFSFFFFFVVVFVSCYCWAFFSLQLLFGKLCLWLRAQFHHYLHIKFAYKFSCNFSVASPSAIFHGRTTQCSFYEGITTSLVLPL